MNRLTHAVAALCEFVAAWWPDQLVRTIRGRDYEASVRRTEAELFQPTYEPDIIEYDGPIS